MIKYILSILFSIVSLNANSNLNQIDELLKAECEYIVYNKGNNIASAQTYINGVYIGMIYADVLNKEEYTKHLPSFNDFTKNVCSESLNSKEFEFSGRVLQKIMFEKINSSKEYYKNK